MSTFTKPKTKRVTKKASSTTLPSSNVVPTNEQEPLIQNDEQVQPVNVPTLKLKSKKQPKEQPRECMICTRLSTDYMRTMIKCLYCAHEYCKDCYKQFFLTKTTPHCMNASCNKIFTEDFLYENFPKTWVNQDLIQHQATIIFDQQKAMLPQTAAELYKIKLRKRIPILQHELDVAENTLRRLRARFASYQTSVLADYNQLLLDQATHTYEQKMQEMVSLSEQCADDKLIIKSTQPCLQTNCKGFCRYCDKTETYICMVCKHTMCALCFTTKDPNHHECDKEQIKTMNMMKKDAKHCPSCKELISKVSGCDQMFCIFCKCCFSWETGEIDKGRVHNPHYFEWKQRQPKQHQEHLQQAPPQDAIVPEAPCMNEHQLLSALEKIMNKLQQQLYDDESQVVWSTKDVSSVYDVYRMMNHIHNVVMPQVVNTRDNQDRYQEHRMQYIQNNMTEAEFKRQIEVTELTQRKKMSHYFVLDMVYNVLRDLFVSIISRPSISSQQDKDDIFEQIHQVITFHNVQQHKIAHTFSQSSFWYIQTQPYTIYRKAYIKNDKLDVSAQNVNKVEPWMNEIERRLFSLYEEELDWENTDKPYSDFFFPAIDSERYRNLMLVVQGKGVIHDLLQQKQRTTFIYRAFQLICENRKRLEADWDGQYCKVQNVEYYNEKKILINGQHVHKYGFCVPDLLAFLPIMFVCDYKDEHVNHPYTCMIRRRVDLDNQPDIYYYHLMCLCESYWYPAMQGTGVTVMHQIHMILKYCVLYARFWSECHRDQYTNVYNIRYEILKLFENIRDRRQVQLIDTKTCKSIIRAFRWDWPVL